MLHKLWYRMEYYIVAEMNELDAPGSQKHIMWKKKKKQVAAGMIPFIWIIYGSRQQ